MAGAVFGEVQLSLCVVGAAFGEVRNDSRGRELLFFRYKMLVASATSNLGCEAGCGRTVLSQGSIMRFIFRGRHSIW